MLLPRWFANFTLYIVQMMSWPILMKHLLILFPLNLAAVTLTIMELINRLNRRFSIVRDFIFMNLNHPNYHIFYIIWHWVYSLRHLLWKLKGRFSHYFSFKRVFPFITQLVSLFKVWSVGYLGIIMLRPNNFLQLQKIFRVHKVIWSSLFFNIFILLRDLNH